MKVGILSDSHDNVPALAKSVGLFNDLEVELVIHAGDLISPFMAKPLNHLQANFIAVYGNNDGEKMGLSHVLSGRIHRAPFFTTFQTKRILVLHEPDNLDALADSGHFDAIIYGHTHDVDVRQGKTLIINPGECGGWVNGNRTVAFWDLASNDVQILPV